jgi:hypothetical protein
VALNPTQMTSVPHVPCTIRYNYCISSYQLDNPATPIADPLLEVALEESWNELRLLPGRLPRIPIPSAKMTRQLWQYRRLNPSMWTASCPQ